VEHFPTLHKPFIVADLDALADQIDVGRLALDADAGHELWLQLEAAEPDLVLDRVQKQVVNAQDVGRFTSGQIAANVYAQLRAFQADPIARATVAAFALNAVVLALLSAASFLLVQVFAARRRLAEFGVLRAMGLASSQLLGLLSLEACAMLVLGMIAGTAVGYGLSWVMRPFLSLTLEASLGKRAIDRLVLDWHALGAAYALLLGVYLVAMLLLFAVLARSQVYRTLRLGDE
jgi:hypothetical protein